MFFPVVVPIAGGAGSVFLSETTLFSPLVLPLLLLIAGAIFVFKSYRGQASSHTRTAKVDYSHTMSDRQGRTPIISSPSALVTSPRQATKNPRAGDTLSFSAAGALAIDFNVRTTVEETVSRFILSAKEKGIELSCLFSSDSPLPFRGDPGELRLILLNLIDHALSSITAGEVVVRAALAEQTSTHAIFRFSVASLSTRPVLSENLAASPPLSAPTFSREPAGLALSKQLVKNWGGDFGYEKNPNGGTTVWFTLTLGHPLSQEFSHLVPPANLSGSRVLVVSNEFSLSDADIRTWELISQHCSPSSPVYSTLSAAAQEGKAHNILMFHCQSLDADTLALVARIRANRALETLRIVLLTNWGRKGDARQARQAGVDAYLMFPVDPPLLFECLVAVLSQPSHPFAPELPLITRYTLAEARTRGRARILIVDSNLADQKHAVRIVEELGYQADVSVTAREAIEANARLPYAAVVLPSQMAGIDGIAAAMQIRQQDQHAGRHTPLIGVRQFQSDDNSVQCLAAGMDAVISKPLDLKSLKVTLEHCRGASVGQETTRASSRPSGNKKLEPADESVERV